MGVYLPYGFEPLTAQHIAERYVKIIDDIDKDMYNDYIDTIPFNVYSPNVLEIKHIPAERNLRLYINGVFYYENVHYYLDREGKKIVWLFTREKGGFDIEPYFKLTAIYDIFYVDNPSITDPSQLL